MVAITNNYDVSTGRYTNIYYYGDFHHAAEGTKAQLDHGNHHKISISVTLPYTTALYRLTKVLRAGRLLKWFDFALLYLRMVSVTLDAATIVTYLTNRETEREREGEREMVGERMRERERRERLLKAKEVLLTKKSQSQGGQW